MRTSRTRAEEAAGDRQLTSALTAQQDVNGYRVIEISSWQDFQRAVSSPELTGWAFRGQEDATWPLESSLSRILRTYRVNATVWARQEARINRIFRRKAHLFLDNIPSEDDVFQWLALMQHHGAPTRLLDFTWSPYVAAFFALEKAKSTAAIWAICGYRLWSQKHTIPETGAVVKTEDMYINSQANYVKWYLKGTLPFAVQGEPFVMNQRLIAQSGTFVVPSVIDRPVEKIIASYPKPNRFLAKLVIDTEKARDEFVSQLYSMNITNATLFPGLDGLARSLNLELELNWEYNPKTLAVPPSFMPDPEEARE